MAKTAYRSTMEEIRKIKEMIYFFDVLNGLPSEITKREVQLLLKGYRLFFRQTIITAVLSRQPGQAYYITQRPLLSFIY